MGAAHRPASDRLGGRSPRRRQPAVLRPRPARRSRHLGPSGLGRNRAPIQSHRGRGRRAIRAAPRVVPRRAPAAGRAGPGPRSLGARDRRGSGPARRLRAGSSLHPSPHLWRGGAHRRRVGRPPPGAGPGRAPPGDHHPDRRCATRAVARWRPAAGPGPGGGPDPGAGRPHLRQDPGRTRRRCAPRDRSPPARHRTVRRGDRHRQAPGQPGPRRGFRGRRVGGADPHRRRVLPGLSVGHAGPTRSASRPVG